MTCRPSLPLKMTRRSTATGFASRVRARRYTCSKLARACEEACRERGVPYLGLDVNPEDNPAAKRLYEGLGYTAVGELHLDGVYGYVNEDGTQGEYEDWCIDMIKKL